MITIQDGNYHTDEIGIHDIQLEITRRNGRLMGPNGAGKIHTFKILLTLTPVSGQYHFKD